MNSTICIVSLLLPLFLEVYKENNIKEMVKESENILRNTEFHLENKGFRNILVGYIKNDIISNLIDFYNEKTKMVNGERAYTKEIRLYSDIRNELFIFNVYDESSDKYKYECILDNYDKDSGKLELIVI